MLSLLQHTLSCLLFVSLILQTQAYRFNGYQIMDLKDSPNNPIEQDIANWTLSAQVSSNKMFLDSLGGPNILGIPGQPTKGHYFERIYNDLPPHNLISFYILFIYNTSRSGPIQYVDYMFDNTLIEGETILSNASKITNVFVKGRVRHSKSSLRVRIISKLDTPSDQEWFAFSYFEISFVTFSGHVVEDIIAFSPQDYFDSIDKTSKLPPFTHDYQDANGKCYKFKDSLCWDAYDEYTCFRCQSPYLWNGTKCTLCSPQCTNCQGENGNYKCVACNDRFSLNKHGVCQSNSNSVFDFLTSVFKVISRQNKYMQYVAMPLPSSLKEAVNKRNILSLQFGIKMPEEIQALFTKHDLPEEAWKSQGLHSSFLVNFWEQLTTLSIIMIAALIFTLLEFASKRTKWTTAQTIFCNLKVLTKWNFLLLMIGVDMDDIIFFSFIEFRTFHLDSIPAIISLLVCLGMIGIALTFIANIYNIAKKAFYSPSTLKDRELFTERWEGFQIFYSGLTNYGLHTQLFYFIYILRTAFSVLFGVILYDSPELQAGLQMLLSLTIIQLIYKSKPFRKTINLVQLLIVEGIMLITSFCFLALALIVSVGRETSQVSETLGDIIIFGNTCVNLVLVVFLINKISLEGSKISEYQKQSPSVSNTVWMQLLAVILQQGGMGFEEVQIPEFYSQETELNRINQLIEEEKLIDSVTVNETTESDELTAWPNEEQPLQDSRIEKTNKQKSFNKREEKSRSRLFTKESSQLELINQTSLL